MFTILRSFFHEAGGLMMPLKRFVWATAAVLMAAALTSCNLGKAPEPTIDVNAVYTSAAQTMIAGLSAQQTQTAAAASPTPQASATPLTSPTPLATFALATGSVPFGTPFTLGTPGVILTPLGTGAANSLASGCDNSAFIADVTIPDGTVMKPGTDFTKTWTIANTGTCTWDEGYALVYQGGTLDGHDINIQKKSDFVDPGKSINFTVKLTASLTPNTYTNCWRMRNDRGSYFGTFLCVTIKVQK